MMYTRRVLQCVAVRCSEGHDSVVGATREDMLRTSTNRMLRCVAAVLQRVAVREMTHSWVLLQRIF